MSLRPPRFLGASPRSLGSEAVYTPKNIGCFAPFASFAVQKHNIGGRVRSQRTDFIARFGAFDKSERTLPAVCL